MHEASGVSVSVNVFDKAQFYRFKVALCSQRHMYLQVNAAECILSINLQIRILNHAVLSPCFLYSYKSYKHVYSHISAARQRMLLEIP